MADPRVVVGSVWRWTDKVPDVSLRGQVRTLRKHDVGYYWLSEESPHSIDPLDKEERGWLEYVSGPTPPKVEPAPGWNRWLPTGPLPRTGPKKFRAGQVWAYRSDCGSRNDGEVFRVLKVDDGIAEVVSYVGEWAGRPSWTLTGDFSGVHAILVQDVGEPHPRDPDILYGRAPAVPMALVGETPFKVGDRIEVALSAGDWHGGVVLTDGRIKWGAGLPMSVSGAWPLATLEAWRAIGRVRISPAPQQPAPAAAPTVSGWMVPEAATEPARAIYPVTPPAWPPPWRPGLPICGRLTPAGYPCEVRGEHPPTGCRVLSEARRPPPAIVYAHEDAPIRLAYCHCSTCRPPGPGLSAADIAALASWPRPRRG